MAFCRFSTSAYQCDVYVYEDVQGDFITHVAANRVIWKVDPPRADEKASAMDHIRAHYKATEMLRDHANFVRVPIDHPCAGKSFRDETAQECAETLEYLVTEGFVVPEYVITQLKNYHEE